MSNRFPLLIFGFVAILAWTGLMVSDSFAGPEASGYYIVTRPDPRMCISPICGGYFVKQVNKPRTRCADGSWQKDCHVAELDGTALGWSADELADFNEQFRQRQALVRGNLRLVPQGPFEVDTLVVNEAWRGQTLNEPIGAFYGLKDSGIVCITFPCPFILESKLNTRIQRLIAGVDLAASGATDTEVEAGNRELHESGIIAAGRHKRVNGPAGQAQEFVASEFYSRASANQPPEGQVCGGIQGLACPEGQFCDIDTPNACGGADLSGICCTPPQECTQQWDPVCGCDGVTYSNDCARRAAKVQLDHPGPCAEP
jgi:hypothetical protein